MKRAKAIIQVLGSGEAFSSTDGNTSYLFNGSGYPTILFDCGYQIPERLWGLKEHVSIDIVCLTHLHADHVFGLVPLICKEWEEKRKRPLRILGARGTEGYIRRLVEMGYPGLLKRLGFTIEFLQASTAGAIDFGKLRIRVAETQHSVRNYTYRVDFEDKSISSFAVSGDGQVTAETCDLVHDVGVHFQEIYTLSKKTPVHMDLKRFEKRASNAKIGRIGVAHHSRSEITAIQKRVRELSKNDPRWFCVKPGLKINLD